MMNGSTACLIGLECIFKFTVGLLLNRLRILQLLNEFHFQHFHLHYFLLLLLYYGLFLCNLAVHFCLCFHLLAPHEFISLHLGYPFLLFDQRVLVVVVFLHLAVEEVLLLFVLHLHELKLFGLFFLGLVLAATRPRGLSPSGWALVLVLGTGLATLAAVVIMGRHVLDNLVTL